MNHNNNIHPPSPPPPPASDLQPRISQMDSNDQSSTSLWDWTHILDFAQHEDDDDHHQPTFHFQPPPDFPPFDLPPLPPTTADKSDRIRKRDPRVTCSNFLAGMVPCACPELDALIREEEEAGVPVKKRVRTARAAPGTSRCQVPGCESDISQLKGYHRRHRVCLRCANATSVVLDAQSKRYCQQCGKFHVLSDFDEGKRSCRRKLQRHNNRRRRKSGSGFRDSDEKEPQHQQELSTEDIFCGSDFQIDGKSSSSQAAEGGTWLNTEEQIATLPSGHIPQNNIQCDSGLSLAASDETQINEEREKYTNSPSYYDNKNPLHSACTTGRISFKLYDWNPAEFPRRLRHQIFQWLASMPVELEGYIRPGCTILTMFIAMPKFMWIKLLEEPVVHIHDLVVAPGSMLCGRGTFLVYLDNIIYRVLKDGTSVVKVEVERESPKLHYVHPTCFEAGKPLEFVACGSNIFQPKLRFLVSFDGKYMTHDVCLPSSCNNTEAGAATCLDHQLFKIYVPHTEPNIYGPAFIEVENQYGLSNFIPILIGSKEICSEINIIHQKLNKPLCSDKSEFPATSSSCGPSVSKQKDLSKLILDVAWLLKDPSLVNIQKVPISYQIQRFNYLLNILIENESTAVVESALKYMKIVMDNSVITSIADVDMSLYQRNMNHARDMLDRKLPKKLDSRLLVRNLEPEENGFDHNFGSDKDSLLRVTNEDKEGSKLPLTGEVFMRIKEWGKRRKTNKPNSGIVFTKSIFASHPLIFVIATATVCFGVCVAILHPVDVGKIATSFRRCMFDTKL